MYVNANWENFLPNIEEKSYTKRIYQQIFQTIFLSCLSHDFGRRWMEGAFHFSVQLLKKFVQKQQCSSIL